MGLRATSSIVRWLTHKRPPPAVPLCDFDRIRYELKPCDVLLVEGRSRVTDVIRMVTQSPWTHAALYIGRLHNIEDPDVRRRAEQFLAPGTDGAEQLIMESDMEMGTVIRPLTDYNRDHLRICRPEGLNFRNAQTVLAQAVDHLGIAYDVRQIMDLLRFLFPWSILPRRWRSSLFYHNAGRPTRTVCSTMIAEAFEAVEFPILPLVKLVEAGEIRLYRSNPRLCTPRDFDYSPYFQIIKYPYVEYRPHRTYSLLPYSGHGALNPDEMGLWMDDQAGAGDGAGIGADNGASGDAQDGASGSEGDVGAEPVKGKN